MSAVLDVFSGLLASLGGISDALKEEEATEATEELLFTAGLIKALPAQQQDMQDRFVKIGDYGRALSDEVLAMGGPEKLAKRKAEGHLNARERIDYLIDEGSFIESGRFARSNRPEVKHKTPADGKVAVTSGLEAGDIVVVAGVDRLQAGQAVVLCPTIAPEDVEQIAERLAHQGVHCIDAPMSGGPVRARDGRMSLMVAAPDAVLARQAALLAALSDHVMRVSERVGDGARTKLVNNLLAGINLVGAAEVMALAERLGLNLSTTLDVIEQSSGQSWIGSDRMRRAIAGDFEPRAHVTLLEKDTRLAVQAAQAAGFEGPLGARAADAFAQAHAAGLADRDDAALLVWLRGQRR